MTSQSRVIVIDLNDAHEYQRLLAGESQTCGMRSGRVFLGGGKSCGLHSTKEHEELLVFLSGKGELLIGEEGDSYQVGRGRVCYIPPNTDHDVKNTGVEPLIYVYCVTPIR